MELNEKIQELRKQKGLTQEELAASLFVSRTAISKWESGRGYPNIESLKAIAKFFEVTIDELLSGEELLTVAEVDAQSKENHFRHRIFGLLDLSIAVLFFLPIFGDRSGESIREVSLWALTGISPWLKMIDSGIVIGIIGVGILTLTFQNSQHAFLNRWQNRISFALNAVGALLFMISLQPYAAAFLFIFLLIKAFMLIKWP